MPSDDPKATEPKGPEHGSVHTPPAGTDDPNPAPNPAPNPNPDPNPNPNSNPDDPIKSLQDELRAMRDELKALKKPATPTTPATPPRQPSESEDDYKDFENEFFSNPTEAIRKRDERLARRIASQLTTQYRQEQQQQKFWEGFYKKHKDLDREKDAFLIESVLQRHITELQDLPTNDAAERLAELTREQIIRYSGGNVPKGSNAKAEGGNPPRPAAPPKEKENVTSLTDLIRQRKQKRAKARTA